MRKKKCCIVISMCGMCEIKKYAKIYTKKKCLEGRKSTAHSASAFSESFVGARSSISWCLMRDLLIILNAKGDPRFASFILFSSLCPYIHLFAANHVDIEMAAKYYFFVCALQFSRLTVNITLQYVVSQKFNRFWALSVVV